MQEERNTPGALLLRLWRTRRSFRGFGLLLFYCHMFMLFSALTRLYLGGQPEYAQLLEAGRILVPLLFALTTLSLFLPPFFWPALILAFLYLPFAARLLLRGPDSSLPWLFGLLGLLLLLLYILYTIFQK